ncbi:MAG: hypothetical protein Q8Q04_01770 [archaeon]|nr:hypothetical protein [archaeon]
MAFGTALIVVALLAITVWLVIEVKRVRHKFFAIFLIGLIIFAYISFTISLNGKEVNFGTPSGWVGAGKLYLSWLGSAFTKVKSITLYAVGMDWKSYNESSVSDEPDEESA